MPKEPCAACGTAAVSGASFCSGCGVPRFGAGVMVAFLPAVIAGVFVGFSLQSAAVLAPPPFEPAGFWDGILALVLATTVPYAPVISGFAVGSTLAVGLGSRSPVHVATAVGLASFLFGGVLLVIAQRLGRPPALELMPYAPVGIAAGALVGAMVRRFWAPPANELELSRYTMGLLIKALGVWLALVLLYAALVTSLVILLVLVVIGVAFWLIGLFLGEDRAPRIRLRIPGAKKSRLRRRFFGGQYQSHTDVLGAEIARSEAAIGPLGEPVFEHRASTGELLGTSRSRTDRDGQDYLENRSADGERIGSSHRREGLLGGEFTEHLDPEGGREGRSRTEAALLGGSHVKHEEG